MTKETTVAKPKSKRAQIEALEARMKVATGRGTDEYRASLQAQIDELNGKPLATGGEVDAETAPRVSET